MQSLIKKLLLINNYSDIFSEFEESFLSHPNYPSVYAITDSLHLLSIESAAIRISKEQFVELPNNFLAVYKHDLVFVTKKDDVVVIENEFGKKQKISNNDFLSGWNEVVVLIEPNNVVVIKKEHKSFKSKTSFLPVIALSSVSFFYNDYLVIASFLLITSMLGLITSVFIVQENVGIKNDVASRLCSINANLSCASVIKSNANWISRWVDFSDLPLLFFSISTISILISPNDSSILVGIMSVLSIPIILYSIWLQKIVLKKWCVLCLIVGLIVIFQSVPFWFRLQSLTILQSLNYFVLLFVSIVITTMWFMLKPMLISKIKADNEVKSLKRFKREYKLFQFLSEEITSLEGFNELKGIHFGNSCAATKLTIIISPSCGHCHDVFKDGFELVKKFPEKFHLNILFNINPENDNNPYKTVVETLLEIQNTLPEKTEEAIVDWHIHKIELSEWIKKWKVEHNGMQVNNQLFQQYNWCSKNEFNYTPVKIVNGKLFPKGYDINELKFFLNDFASEVNESQILVQA